jgi:hypothetical protein
MPSAAMPTAAASWSLFLLLRFLASSGVISPSFTILRRLFDATIEE